MIGLFNLWLNILLVNLSQFKLPPSARGAHDSHVLQNSSMGVCLAQGAGGDDGLIGKLFVKPATSLTVI